MAIVVIKCLIWLKDYELFFGSHSIIDIHYQNIGWLKNIGFILFQYPNLSWLFIASCLLLSGFMLFSKNSNYWLLFFLKLSLWLLILNLQNRVYAGLTAGNFLLNQLLFFSCFIHSARDTNKKHSYIQNGLHNAAAIGIIAQICLLYFLSGLAKLLDNNWLTGQAVWQTMQVDVFSPYQPLQLAGLEYFFAVICNYTVMAYQLLFPLLVWLPKFKKIFLLIGVLMHVYIGIHMGLIEFSSILLVSYLYFWPFKTKLV